MKFLLGIIVIFLVGCTSEISDNTQLVNNKAIEIINLLKVDNIKDMEVTSAQNNEAIIENQFCTITIHFQDDKIVHLTSMRKDENSSEYSCVFRTLARDSDIIGENEQVFETFMAQFRTGETFEMNGFKFENKEGLDFTITKQ
jgi:hypothetical protein